MPEHLKNQYQYHTESTMAKLKNQKAPLPEYGLESAIDDYVKNYL